MHAMAIAKLNVAPVGRHPQYLSVVKLVLAGFVVDASPFVRWFDPNRLRQIYFKFGCIDAGFFLPAKMDGLVHIVKHNSNPNVCKVETLTKFSPDDVKLV